MFLQWTAKLNWRLIPEAPQPPPPSDRYPDCGVGPLWRWNWKVFGFSKLAALPMVANQLECCITAGSDRPSV